MSSSLGLGDLESEPGCILSEQLDLLVAVSLFIVLGPFVDISLSVLQHAIDESGEAVGMAVMAFGAPSLVRKRRYWAPR
jgi:hypothetical protein